MTKFKDIHNCKKCQGKIIAISTDQFGNMYCGYCGEHVPEYNRYIEDKTKELLRKKILEDEDWML